jgi:FtsH-binding integral membrane protein
MSAPDDEVAIAARRRIESRNRERERRAARRSRRDAILLWVCAPLLYPAAGAAAAIVVIEANPQAEVPLFVAALLVPMGLTLLLARRRSWLERIVWPLITLAAELALMFWVGLVWLDYGPG